jgi:hypothetical protein
MLTAQWCHNGNHSCHFIYITQALKCQNLPVSQADNKTGWLFIMLYMHGFLCGFIPEFRNEQQRTDTEYNPTLVAWYTVHLHVHVSAHRNTIMLNALYRTATVAPSFLRGSKLVHGTKLLDHVDLNNTIEWRI